MLCNYHDANAVVTPPPASLLYIIQLRCQRLERLGFIVCRYIWNLDKIISDLPRMSWKDVVTMAADVARNGFNVTHDLGKYSVQITG